MTERALPPVTTLTEYPYKVGDHLVNRSFAVTLDYRIDADDWARLCAAPVIDDADRRPLAAIYIDEQGGPRWIATVLNGYFTAVTEDTDWITDLGYKGNGLADLLGRFLAVFSAPF